MYGSAAEITSLVFLEPAPNATTVCSDTLQLFSTAADGSASAWKLLRDSAGGVTGLRQVALPDLHPKSIPCCHVVPSPSQLFTAGLDAVCKGYFLRRGLDQPEDGPFLGGGSDGQQLLDVGCIAKQPPSMTLATNDQPVSAMMLIDSTIWLGTLTGLVWGFNTRSKDEPIVSICPVSFKGFGSPFQFIHSIPHRVLLL